MSQEDTQVCAHYDLACIHAHFLLKNRAFEALSVLFPKIYKTLGL